MWRDHIVYPSSTDGYLGRFYLLAVVNHSAENTCGHVFVWTPVFNSLGYILRSGIAESYGDSMVKFLKIFIYWGFPCGAVVENPPANAGDTGSIPGPGGSHMPRSN